MRDDPIVAEVRRVREELAARFGFDVKAIFDDLRNSQAALGNRLVSRKKSAETVDAAFLALCEAASRIPPGPST